MIAYLITLYWRFKAMRRAKFRGNNSTLVFHRDVKFNVQENSQIILNENAQVKLGYSLLEVPKFASHQQSIIHVGRDAQIVFNGPVAIAPGATIRIKDGATLIFNGKNHIGHNTLIICSSLIEIGEGSAISWNVTLIDDDGHHFQDSKGRKIKGFKKSLIIGKNVGIQMNTLIPRGVSIGDNAVISCGTVVRRDVPANSLAYQEANLRIREGISAPKS